MNLLVFILVCFGLTQVLVYGKILEPIRPKEGKLGELFACPMCLGFWIGVLIWLLSGFTTLFTFDKSIVTGLMLGFLSSGTSYILCTLFGDDGLKVEVKK
jgi:hypothetical protein